MKTEQRPKHGDTEARASETVRPDLMDVCSFLVTVGGYECVWAAIVDGSPDHLVPIGIAGYPTYNLGTLLDLHWAQDQACTAEARRAVKSGRAVARYMVPVERESFGYPGDEMPAGMDAVRSRVFMPIVAEGEVTGLLAIYSKQSGAFQARDRRRIKRAVKLLARKMDFRFRGRLAD